ncbi:hypothetical protein Glove_541g10 [Diversispora epigaea]|uniref:Uncharacterized protein n=1 Tax=Diversispora epigaea TaxID=1348612 RepID=A0A397GCW7_9GLOM|nr:hypothetical protein Glove_541g10 [Diversispora epigaea]
MEIYDSDTESNESCYSFNELSELNVFEYNKENYTKAFLASEQKTSNKNDENEEDYEEYNIDSEIQEVTSQETIQSELSIENEPVIQLDSTSKTNFSPCVLFDYINNKLQMCGQIASRNICQLIGTWQIDNKAVSEFQSKGIPLGVCMNHFNYDQKNHNAFTKQLRRIESSEVRRRRCLLCFKNNYFFSCGIGCKEHLWKIWEKHIQVACIGLYTCNAIHACQGVSEKVLEEVPTVRYICYSCYESYGGHLNQRPGPGKRKSTCEQCELHKDDIMKSLELVAQWIIYVANYETKEKKQILLASILVPILNFLFLFETSFKVKYYDFSNNSYYSNSNEFNENINSINLITVLSEIPSFFFIKLLLSINNILNNINNINSKINWTDDRWKEIGKKLGTEIWNSRKEINQKKSEIQLPSSLYLYYSSFPKFLTNFFNGVISEIFKKKLVIINYKRNQCEKSLKVLDEEHIIKCVTFIISLIISMAFPNLGVWFTQVMASMSRKLRLLSSFHKLLSTLHISGHTDYHERRIEKQRMTKIDPSERMIREKNIWNLAVIDNIDFKEKTFSYGNIFDTTRGSSHTTLRMAFQMQMPFSLEEKASDEKKITSPSGLFGMNDQIRNIWNMFDEIIDNLLNFQTDSENQITFNTDFDMTTIHQEILKNIDYGCLAGTPNIVILETGGIPNSDDGIFQSTEMYKQDFKLEPHDYLDVVADEAIFRRLVKQREQWPNLRPILGQWHTSKDMCGVLIVLFSSYGIFDLAKALGVKFLDKLDKVVDYRSTVRVLELIWCAVTIAIRIYIRKKNLNKYNIIDADSGVNSILRIWYLYYKWASIFKAHRVGIRVGNYQLQKNALACFAGLFASAGKSNYSTSVAQYLGILAQYPKLEKKLECVSSIKIDEDEKRKGHYFAFDEALETFGVKFIKQNITGNLIDINNLKLQIKAAQSERDRIGILLSEYLDDPSGSIGQRAINTQKVVMWNLVHELLSAFQHSDEYNRYHNSLWNTTSADQFTMASVLRLHNCFPDGVLRIENIFLQDVISVQKSNKVGRRRLGVTRWKPSEKQSTKKKNLLTQLNPQDCVAENSNQTIVEQQMQPNVETTTEDNINDQDELPKKKARQTRRETKPEEKRILETLINNTLNPTNDQINQVKELLGSEWDKNRIMQYVSRHKHKYATASTSLELCEALAHLQMGEGKDHSAPKNIE